MVVGVLVGLAENVSVAAGSDVTVKDEPGVSVTLVAVGEALGVAFPPSRLVASRIRPKQ